MSGGYEVVLGTIDAAGGSSRQAGGSGRRAERGTTVVGHSARDGGLNADELVFVPARALG